MFYVLAGLATAVGPLVARSKVVQNLLHKLDERDDDLSEAATRPSEAAPAPVHSSPSGPTSV